MALDQTGTSTIITYEKVRTDAKTIKECASVMSEIFEEFGTSMNKVGAEDVFYGDTSETFGQKFDSVKGKFDSYIKLVNQFADAITSASESTAATERILNNELDKI